MALPIMRSRWHEDLTEGEARALLEDALRVLFYRDCRALNRIQIAKVRRQNKPSCWSLGGQVTLIDML